jgi:hypothetical protein
LIGGVTFGGNGLEPGLIGGVAFGGNGIETGLIGGVTFDLIRRVTTVLL